MSRYIDANELLTNYQNICNGVACADCSLLSLDGECKLEKMIKDAPIADVAPVVHGHWIPGNTPDAFWVCSHCGFPSEAHGAFKLYKYCPNCGAKMDEVTE